MASTTKFTFTTVTSSGWNTQNTSNLSVLETALSSCRTGVLGETVERFDSASMHMSDGLWYKAYSFSNCHNVAPCFGVFLSGGDAGDTVRIQTEGAITNPDWALKPGWPVMMGNTPGSVRCAALAHGNQIIGFADSDHTIYLENNFQFQDTWTSTTTTTTTVTTTSSTISTTSSTNSTTSSTISTTSTTVTGTGTTTSMSTTTSSSSTTTTSSSSTTTAVPPPSLWLDGWLYRKEITISRASGAVTNYQMKVLVGETSGATGEEVDCAGHVMTSFADLRFTNSENEPLDYWIESITGTTPNQLATVWVECDYIGTAATVFYMYYGNPAATSESSGANTFILFDDFERGADGDTVGGSWTEDAAHVHISTEQDIGNTTGYTGTRAAKLVGFSTTYPDMTIPLTPADGTYSINLRAFKENASRNLQFSQGNGSLIIQVRIADTEAIQYHNGSAWIDAGASVTADAWALIGIKNINFTAGTFDIYKDDAIIKSGATMVSSAVRNGVFFVRGSNVTGEDGWIDNFRVNNWRSTAPAYGTWGSEVRAGWLSGWSYRKEITISRASGAVTNYQIKVLVGETSGASGEDVDCAGHVMTSFADLRFTNSENEPLDYWIESITGTTPNQLATVWVECDYIGTAATVFYMYYGNSTASSESSGTNTFIVFDDFERGSDGDALGGIWSATVASAVISTEQTYGTGSRSAKLLGGATDWTRSMSCDLAASNEIAIRFRFFKEANAKFDVWHGNGTKCVVVRYEADEDILYYDTDTTVNCQAEAWDFFEITNINFTAGTFDLYYTNEAVAKSGAVMGTDASANGKFRIYDRASGSGVDTYIDNFIVRNWRTTGPVLGAWGSEEVQ